MENGLKTIRELFDGRKVFTIPRYQRAYSWGEPQLRDFADDFENQREDKQYFFGTVLFQEHPRQGSFDRIDVVDGQQRLTTLVVFLKVLHDKLREAGESEEQLELLAETFLSYKKRNKLEAIPTDRDFFRTYVLDNNLASQATIQTPSQRRLLDALEYFGRRLEAVSLDEMRAFMRKIESARVLTYSVLDSAEATLIFETTNDRGKPLTNLEKTKSFLMYRTYLAGDADEVEVQLDALQERFADIYRHYEAIEDRIDENSLLQYHFIGFHPWGERKDYQRNVQTVKRRVIHLTGESNDSANDFIDSYSRTLRESFAHAKHLFLEPSLALRDLLALGRTANFFPIILEAWAHRAGNEAQVERVIRLLEIISFRVYGIRQRKSDTARDHLYRLARDFTGDFEQLVAALRSVAGGYATDKAFRERLTSPSFYHDVGRREATYFFWKYENHLRAHEQPVASPMSHEALLSGDSRLKLSIEHVAPQTPEEGKVIADDEVLPAYTEEFVETYLHSIGNLTIDPLSANSSKQNVSFDDKHARYFSRAPFKTQTELVDYLDDGKWTAASIAKRTEALVEFALREWDPNR